MTEGNRRLIKQAIRLLLRGDVDKAITLLQRTLSGE